MHKVRTVIVELEYPMDDDSFRDYSDEYYGIGTELIRCKDCKYFEYDCHNCNKWFDNCVNGEGYCAWAIRKDLPYPSTCEYCEHWHGLKREGRGYWCSKYSKYAEEGCEHWERRKQNENDTN